MRVVARLVTVVKHIKGECRVGQQCNTGLSLNLFSVYFKGVIGRNIVSTAIADNRSLYNIGEESF